MKYDDTVILLFAKAPVEGKVNTRLIPDIGVREATRLQEEFINQRLQMLEQADLCHVVLMCSPDKDDNFFLKCQQQYNIDLSQQSGSDLGARMFNGVHAALELYKFCIVIGTDAPALDVEEITKAIDTLHAGKKVVIVPAEDGGYVLIGMRYVYNCLFEVMPWGSSEVLPLTRDRLLTNRISFEELSPCWDVDRIEDYQRYLDYRSDDK